MAPKVHLAVRLTLPEAKAIARPVKIGISAIETDEQPVNNAVTLQRAFDACKCGLEKIETVISTAEEAVSRHTRP